MASGREVSRPVALLIVVVYAVLVWLAAAFFVSQQRRMQSGRRGQRSLMRLFRR